jgi:hypothetical protein
MIALWERLQVMIIEPFAKIIKRHVYCQCAALKAPGLFSSQRKMIWAGKQDFFNESSVAAIRFYSATKLTHIVLSGVFTSIRLP